MPETLPYTDDEDANRLLAKDPFALLVGLVLYQQVPIEKAFMGPQVLKDRLGGTLDAKTVTTRDPEELEAIFKERPAIHRFPANMAKRVQGVAAYIDPELVASVASVGVVLSPSTMMSSAASDSSESSPVPQAARSTAMTTTSVELRFIHLMV